MTLLGIDTGGTFTDFVLWRDGALRTHKVLSTPQAPEQAILQGIAELGLQAGDDFRIVHGSTVATNAVLEGKGVRTVFITNHGLADLLTLGRQTRRELYNLQPAPVPPPVPADLCLEVGGRLDATGKLIDPLPQAELESLAARLKTLAPRAVAINLLFSYLDPGPEQALADVVAAALPGDCFISRSSAILPEFREYERGMTTWLNAWVGPLVEGYLRRLQAGVPQAQIAVMQSSGGTIAADQAGDQAVHMLLSGPAGGLAAARAIGEAVDRPRLLTFDMGGTSTDVALIDGALQLTSEGYIGDYPVAVPMVDMHTIGAGGGSLASIDSGGVLQVGPESAGADPGPACYGRGGTRPTVTDANLLLGRLRPDAFLGGGMALDMAAARQAMASLAEPLGLDIETAAAGVIRIANEHMAQALRVMSVQRGIDPRELTLMSFGGAGGLHVCALAEALDMHQALVPVQAGVLSALGMLVAPRSRELSQTLLGVLTERPPEAIEAVYARLEAAGRAELQAEGVAAEELQVRRSADLRYRGQSYTLNLEWTDPDRLVAAFHRRHVQRYGHALELPVELVNLRVSLRGPTPPLPQAEVNRKPATSCRRQVEIHGETGTVPVYARHELTSGQRLQGPALITETVSTTFVARDWTLAVDDAGNLLLSRAPRDTAGDGQEQKPLHPGAASG